MHLIPTSVSAEFARSRVDFQKEKTMLAGFSGSSSSDLMCSREKKESLPLGCLAPLVQVIDQSPNLCGVLRRREGRLR